MISTNFNSYASLAIFIIIPFLFCFFLNAKLYMLVIRVLTVFENPQNSDRPFRFLFEDFRLCSI